MRTTSTLYMLLLLCCFSSAAYGRQSDSTVTDTVPRPARHFIETVQQAARAGALSSQRHHEEGKRNIRQRELIDGVKQTIQKAKIYLKNGIDTLAFTRKLAETKAAMELVKDGVFVNKGTNQTQRNLTISSIILQELYNDLLHQQQTLEKYRNDLIGFKYQIDSLTADSTLYMFPSDSLQVIKYAQRLLVASREITPVETRIHQAAANVEDLLLKVEPVVYDIHAAMEDIEHYRRDLSRQTWHKEFNSIWEPVLYSRPFSEILRFSWAKESMAFSFYIRQHRVQLFMLLALVLASWLFVRSLRRLLAKDGLIDPAFTGQLVVRYPLLSAVFVTCSIFQFIFPTPPFIFNIAIWLITLVCLTIIFSRYITGFWMVFWLVTSLLFTFACLDNLILQASRMERIIMLGLTAAGTLYGGYILFSGRRPELREKAILYFISFMTAFEAVAFVLNLFGRYNMSKTFMVAGYIGAINAILLLWVVRLINEGLQLANKVYQRQDRHLFYLNFSRVGDKAPFFFYVALVLGWLVLVGRNFYGFKDLADPLGEFLSRQRTLGEYEFSINILLVFVLILFCSLFLSRVISYFGADPGRPHTPESERAAVGSWVLLLRIFVICLGLFLAFAATGIPIDRITIILGALGVGVGLGLQGLVSNLVSGLIIAFEKPVNVGDVIEINGTPATMKSIGFRSSIVTSIDGPCIVIPNGELLNHHLVNWTMGKSVKRLSVVVGVAYGTDLSAAIKLLENIVQNDERILKRPAPAVLAKEFSQSSIELELMFWARSITEWRALRSDVVRQVDLAFKSAGIVIPFPQRDLHIKTAPGKPVDTPPL